MDRQKRPGREGTHTKTSSHHITMYKMEIYNCSWPVGNFLKNDFPLSLCSPAFSSGHYWLPKSPPPTSPADSPSPGIRSGPQSPAYFKWIVLCLLAVLARLVGGWGGGGVVLASRAMVTYHAIGPEAGGEGQRDGGCCVV